jgi:hypothetical protein
MFYSIDLNNRSSVTSEDYIIVTIFTVLSLKLELFN